MDLSAICIFTSTVSLLLSVLFIQSVNSVPGAATAGVQVALTSLEQTGKFTVLLSLLRSTGVDLALEALDQVTVFAPSDAAFGLLPSGELGTLSRQDILDILDLHAIPRYLSIPATAEGSFVSFSGEEITFSRTKSSVVVRCGLERSVDVVSVVYDQEPVSVYTVDGVLVPQRILSRVSSVQALSPSPAPSPAAAFALQNASLATVLTRFGVYNTLVSLLSATGTESLIESFPSVTYLAPSDDAFREIPKDILRNLSDSQLAALLKFHALGQFLPGFGNVSVPIQTLASGNDTLVFKQVKVNDRDDVVVDTGVEQAKVLRVPLYVERPRLSVFSVNKVLLPVEIASPPASSFTFQPAASPHPGQNLNEPLVESGAELRNSAELVLIIVLCCMLC